MFVFPNGKITTTKQIESKLIATLTKLRLQYGEVKLEDLQPRTANPIFKQPTKHSKHTQYT